MEIIVKTPREIEKIAASHIEEVLEHNCKVKPRPWGLLGVVLVDNTEDKRKAAKLISENVPEASQVLVVEKEVKPDIEEICKAAAKVALEHLKQGETFAIRTTKRGKHEFSTIDVNVAAGRAVQEATGAEVNLDYPDKAIYIEIFQNTVAICVVPGTEERKKMKPGKPLVLDILRRISVIQMPYTGPLDGVYRMGVRIGRAIQCFELGELYIAHYKPVTAEELHTFLKGVLEGRDSRYRIQVKSYGRPVHKVPVYVYEMYQLVRHIKGKPVIVTDPRGEYLTHVKDKIAELFSKGSKVYVLIGAREGIPVGIFRFADLVVDLIPQITISTDYAPVATVIGIVAALEETGALPKFTGKRKRK